MGKDLIIPASVWEPILSLAIVCGLIGLGLLLGWLAWGKKEKEEPEEEQDPDYDPDLNDKES